MSQEKIYKELHFPFCNHSQHRNKIFPSLCVPSYFLVCTTSSTPLPTRSSPIHPLTSNLQIPCRPIKPPPHRSKSTMQFSIAATLSTTLALLSLTSTHPLPSPQSQPCTSTSINGQTTQSGDCNASQQASSSSNTTGNTGSSGSAPAISVPDASSLGGPIQAFENAGQGTDLNGQIENYVHENLVANGLAKRNGDIDGLGGEIEGMVQNAESIPNGGDVSGDIQGIVDDAKAIGGIQKA